jgi:FlaG/FlaF family flagellin (archaellin)
MWNPAINQNISELNSLLAAQGDAATATANSETGGYWDVYIDLSAAANLQVINQNNSGTPVYVTYFNSDNLHLNSNGTKVAAQTFLGAMGIAGHSAPSGYLSVGGGNLYGSMTWVNPQTGQTIGRFFQPYGTSQTAAADNVGTALYTLDQNYGYSAWSTTACWNAKGGVHPGWEVYLDAPDTFLCRDSANAGVWEADATFFGGGNGQIKARSFNLTNASQTAVLQMPSSGFAAGTYNYVCTGTSTPFTCTLTTASGSSGALVRIAQVVVSTATPTITFSSIPGTYTNLQLVINGQTSSGSAAWMVMQFNGDTGSTYDYTYMLNGGSSNQNNQTGIYTVQLPSSSATNRAGGGQCNINSYAGTTFFKTSTCNSSAWASPITVGVLGGDWQSTTAVTSIALMLADSSNFVTGTTATLYGMQ